MTNTTLRLLPVVARETFRFWVRRNLVAFTFIGAAAVAAPLLMFADQIENAPLIAAGLLFYAPVILGLLCMSGIVSDERASGLIVMWFQKPGSLFRAYLTRYVLNQLVLVAGTTLLSAVVVMIGRSTGAFENSSSFRVVIGMLFLAVLPAAVVFAISAFGVRRDSTVALAVLVMSFMFAAVLLRSDHVLAAVVRTVAFPMDAFGALIASGPAYPPGLARPIGIILAHIVGWSLLGLLGLRYTEHQLKKGH